MPPWASERPRLAAWLRWASPAWATRRCWRKLGLTWSLARSTRWPLRAWPRVDLSGHRRPSDRLTAHRARRRGAWYIRTAGSRGERARTATRGLGGCGAGAHRRAGLDSPTGRLRPGPGAGGRIAVRRQQRLPRRAWVACRQPRSGLGLVAAIAQLGRLAAYLRRRAIRYAGCR